MSIERIVANIEENILNRQNASIVLEALEKLTQKPVSFLNMIKSEQFEFFENNNEEHEEEDEIIIEKLPPNRLSGFQSPVEISDNLKRFITNGDFGFDTSNLMAVTDGITSRAILTVIFNIYSIVNKMQKDPENKQMLTATSLMYDCFGKTFEELQKKRPEFNPERFRYASMQSIVCLNVSNVDENDRDKLADMLDVDTEVVREHMNKLRAINK